MATPDTNEYQTRERQNSDDQTDRILTVDEFMAAITRASPVTARYIVDKVIVPALNKKESVPDPLTTNPFTRPITDPVAHTIAVFTQLQKWRRIEAEAEFEPTVFKELGGNDPENRWLVYPYLLESVEVLLHMKREPRYVIGKVIKGSKFFQ